MAAVAHFGGEAVRHSGIVVQRDARVIVEPGVHGGLGLG